MSTDAPQTPSSGLVSLANRPKRAATPLFVAAAVFAGVAAWFGYKYGLEYFAVWMWAGWMAVVMAGAGVWLQVQGPRPEARLDDTRLFILGVAGLAGLLTAFLLGGGLAYTWWNDLMGGWSVWQGARGWRIWVTFLTWLAGLAILFVGLQLAHADERTNPLLRRILYGYNTALSAFLLLAILVGLNLLVYTTWGPFAYLGKEYPWAISSIYSLSSKSEKILESLDKPTRVYVIMPRGDELYRPTNALLSNVQGVTDKVQVEYLSPDVNQEKVEQLAKDYKISDRRGILVLYGTGPDAQTRFIKYEDLSGSPDFSAARKSPVYKGESVLLGELNTLVEGKEKPVIYFTQGNGELDVTNTRATQKLDEGIGLLKQRLETANYTVKGLQISPLAGVPSKSPDIHIGPNVPDDAAIVVVAGPTKRWPDYALKALRDYVLPTNPNQKKGKLIALMDVTLTPEKRMEQTGLEPLLAEFNVQVGDNQVLHVPNNLISNPVSVLAVTPQVDPPSKNPLAAAFDRQAFVLYTARTVQSKSAGSPGGSTYTAETLLEALPSHYIWAETNLAADVRELTRDLMNNRDVAEKKLSRDPLSLAVTVTERVPDPAGGPHAMMSGEQRPQLVVFGDATLLSNRYMSDRSSGTLSYDLFSSCLAWLRERPAGIGIEPKKTDVFVLNPSTNVTRLILLPAALVLVGVIGLGTSIWVVRRR